VGGVAVLDDPQRVLGIELGHLVVICGDGGPGVVVRALGLAR
jgi:hypothetical protein